MRTSDFDPITVETFNSQLRKATIVVLVVFGALVLRLWFLQIASGPTYRLKSESNRLQLYDIAPVRGLIFDRNGKVLVNNRPSYNLYAVPEGIPDRSALLESLRRVAGLDPQAVAARLEEASPAYPFRPVQLERDISRDQLAVIETHRFNLPGTVIRVRPQRHYVAGDLGAHLLGYLGEIDEGQLRSGKFPENKRGDLIGRSGVERKLEHFLSGTRGGEQVEVDAAGRKIRVVSRKPPQPGASVYLTIDAALQEAAEQALEGKQGAVVATNPLNGQVLAMASSPAYDPNWFVEGIDRESWRHIVTSKDFPLQNRAVAGQYPPGSVFKIVVALAGLAEGVIDPDETVFCRGVHFLGRHRYHCWKKYGHGGVDLHRAIRESCDVYFYTMGQRLGVDRIAEYAGRFGLGQSTGFDRFQEKRGLVPTRKWKRQRFGVSWQAGETVSLSIGQSFILVTPIQMANMISAVFNGGILYRPQETLYIVKSGDELAHEFSPEVIGRLGIAPEHLERVQRALMAVVNEPHGTGGRARIQELPVAGKTGTAQVVNLAREKAMNEKGELPDEFRDHAWFVAVAPANHPQISVSVLVEHAGHGGSVAAPIAKKLITAYLNLQG